MSTVTSIDQRLVDTCRTFMRKPGTTLDDGLRIGFTLNEIEEAVAPPRKPVTLTTGERGVLLSKRGKKAWVKLEASWVLVPLKQIKFD